MNVAEALPKDPPKRIRGLLAHVRIGDGCWVWTGTIQRDGYGIYGKPSRRAHRLIYELLVGPIPEGLQIDHLCRVRHCVNPAHMEPVTIAENVRRGDCFPILKAIAAKRREATTCLRGHLFDEPNTYWNPSGSRACRACNQLLHAKYRKEARDSLAKGGAK